MHRQSIDSSSSSTRTFFYYGYWVEERYCDCGSMFDFKTHWRDDDIGRRYYICQKYGVGGCGTKVWYDPPMCARAIKLIPRLLRKMDKHDLDKLQTQTPDPLPGCIDDSCRRKMERLKGRIRELRLDVQRQRNKANILLCIVLLIFVVFLIIWLRNAASTGSVKPRLSIRNNA